MAGSKCSSDMFFNWSWLCTLGVSQHVTTKTNEVHCTTPEPQRPPGGSLCSARPSRLWLSGAAGPLSRGHGTPQDEEQCRLGPHSPPGTRATPDAQGVKGSTSVIHHPFAAYRCWSCVCLASPFHMCYRIVLDWQTSKSVLQHILLKFE